MIFEASSTVEAIGFSRKTCLPAASASIAGSVCWSHMVTIETASMLGIGKHVAVVVHRLRHPKFRRHGLEPLGRPSAERGELKVRNPDDSFALDLSKPSESDDANA